ncbi:MAG: efflux RND transporter periplasmic adaptor subunit [Vitreoscilla sp.]|nr:efflux RND transporter periplasmic adaptor subunit [Polaromonas sp.]
MSSKVIYSAIAVVGIAAASGAAWWLQQPKNSNNSQALAGSPPAAGAPLTSASGPARPPTVEATKIEIMRLTDDTQAVGSLRSRRGVVLRPEVSGRITQLNFTDGQRVKKGQLLVQLDDQLPLAQVQQSMAELSIAQANQKRNQELVSQNFISQRSLDESAANLQVAQAKLALSKATANRLKIIAPFDGIVGIRSVNVGDYLKDGADIVNVEDLDAIFVDFRLPERFQSKVKTGQTASIDIDALPGRKYNARIQAIDPLIDANGRSVGVRGCIDNRQLQLRPGMFARVNAVFGVRETAMVIPEEAIIPQGPKVFVIKLLPGTNEKTRISQRVEVKVGLRRPGKVEILEGLEPTDTVVANGQQRVQKDGMLVNLLDLSARGGKPGESAGPPGAAAPAPAASAPAAMPPAVAASAPAVPAAMAMKLAVPAGKMAKAPEGPNPCNEGMADAGKPGGKPGQGPGQGPGQKPAAKTGQKPA